MNLLATRLGLADLLANGTTGIYNGLQVILGTNPINPTRESVSADLDAPTITGYAPVAVTWNGVGYDPAASQAYVSDLTIIQFNGPSDSTGQTINSIGLRRPAAVGPPALDDVLVACGGLDTPAPLLIATDQLNLALELRGDGTIVVTQL